MSGQHKMKSQVNILASQNGLHNQLIYSNTKNSREMSFNKVSPKLFGHVTNHSTNYIYCYLDPFEIFDETVKFPTMEDIHFYYLPYYIGKATSSTGYRHFQHIKEFSDFKDKKDIKNPDKMNYMLRIEEQMKSNKNPNLPSSWEEYAKDWIVILNRFDDQRTLATKERELIKYIGTIKRGNGPLINLVHY